MSFEVSGLRDEITEVLLPPCIACRKKRRKCNGQEPGCVIRLSPRQRPPKTSQALVRSKVKQNVNSKALIEDLHKSARDGDYISTVRNIIVQASAPSMLSSPCPAPIFKALLLSHFACEYLPKSVDGSDPAGLGWSAVMPHLSKLVGDSVILDAALGAAASNFLGDANDDIRLKMEGAKQYGMALRMMSKVAGQSKQLMSETTLASVVMLTMREVFSTEDGSMGWVSHCEGLASLLRQHKSPWNGLSPLGRQWWRIARTLVLYHAMGRRVNVLKDEGDTIRTKPLEQLTEPTDLAHWHIDSLMDIMQQMPILLERIDLIKARSHVVILTSAQDIISKALILRRRMVQWYESLEEAFGLPLFVKIDTPPEKLFDISVDLASPHESTSKLKNVTYDPKTDVFRYSIIFKNPDIGYWLNTYWSGIMVLYEIMRSCQALLAAAMGRPLLAAGAVRLSLQERFDSETAASHISQSFPYCFHPSRGHDGPIKVAYGMYSVKNYYHREWLQTRCTRSCCPRSEDMIQEGMAFPPIALETPCDATNDAWRKYRWTELAFVERLKRMNLKFLVHLMGVPWDLYSEVAKR